MKKAFTLIELLAVIIILAIVALIATPIILNVINDAKDSAAKSEASMIVSGINNYCATAAMKEQLDGTTSICTDGVTKEEVSTMVDLGNAKVNSITYDGKVTSLEIVSNGRTVTYNGSEYSIDGEVVETPEAPTYEYSVGDEVTLIDGTKWVVVKNTTASESEVKLMATSNVKNNLTTETGTSMFTSTQSEYALAYDSSGKESNVWATSTLKAYLDGTVKPNLETSLNTTINDITIWGVEELTSLGCTVTGNETDGYSIPSCDNTTTWYSKVFQNTYSWIKLPVVDYSYRVWYAANDGNFQVRYVDPSSYGNGIRPVITISKDVIVKSYYAFGTPTTSSPTNYQDVISSSGSNVFAKLQGDQYSLCIYKNNTLECFKNNNYTEESERVKNVFGTNRCVSYDSNVECDDGAFDCSLNSIGEVWCLDYSSGYDCYMFGDGTVNCD